MTGKLTCEDVVGCLALVPVELVEDVLHLGRVEAPPEQLQQTVHLKRNERMQKAAL